MVLNFKEFCRRTILNDWTFLGLFVIGVYCKWLIRGEGALELQNLKTYINLVSEGCHYDGLVIYTGTDTTASRHGQFGVGTTIVLQLIA